jgi:hypothetical protein
MGNLLDISSQKIQARYASITRREMLLEARVAVRFGLRSEILTLLEHPPHLVIGLLYSGVWAHERVNLLVLARGKGRVEVGTVVSTTLAGLDLSSAIAFETFGSCTSNYGRPSVTHQLTFKVIPGGCHLRMGRPNGLQAVGFGECLDFLVDVGRLGESTNHEDRLKRSVLKQTNDGIRTPYHTLSCTLPARRACCICPSRSSYVRRRGNSNISFISVLVW